MVTGTGRDRRSWTLAVASLASLMIALDLLVVSTALTTIRDDLGASVVELQWTVIGYSLSFASLLLTGAALGDRFGRRRVFVLGLGVFVASSAACALAPNVEVLVTARIVQGVGAALTIPVALALVSAVYPTESRGRAIGILEGVTGLATIAGPVVGGGIAGGLAWQWIFWVNVPIGLLTGMVALAKLEESTGAEPGLDVLGIVLAGGSALGVVWGLVRGNTVGWSSGEVVCALIIGAGLGVVFVRWENATSGPMLPMRLFKSRAFSAPVAASFFLFAALYGSVFFLAQFLQTAQGHAPLTAGLLMVPWTASLIIIAPVAGVLGDRIGERPVLTAGLVLNALGLAAVSMIADPGVAYWKLLAALLVTGIGASAAIPVVQSALIGAVDDTDIGKASGANNMFREIGGAFGVAVLVAVFTTAGGYASPADFTEGFTSSLAVCAVLALAGAGASLFLPAQRR